MPTEMIKDGDFSTMNITPKQVLTLAAKYIGYKEKASGKDLYSFEDNAGRGNFTMFQAELDKAKFWNTPKNGYEWCTSFVAWCFWRIAGSEAKDILCLTGPYGASCVSWAKYYAAQARLFTKPQVGDQYFQRDSRDGLPCHTGIVESVNGSMFVTIEGNYQNSVQRVRHSLNSGTVYGFGRPKYINKTEEDEMVRYKTINDMPKGYQAEAQQLVALGFNGKGGDKGLDVTEDMLRTMIVNMRMCKALIAALPDDSLDKDALFAEFKAQLKLKIDVEVE